MSSLKILINAASAKLGGAVTYLKGIARELKSSGSPHEFLFVVPEQHAEVIHQLGSQFKILTTRDSFSVAQRIWFEQVELREILRKERVDVLFSTANFGMFCCPCPQILLLRNCLYFSDGYSARQVQHKAFLNYADVILRRWLASASAAAADLVLTPSEAMLRDVRRFADLPSAKVAVNQYGVDVAAFGAMSRNPSQPVPDLGSCRLLFTGIYGEHKNLCTLFSALKQLVESGVPVTLITSADPYSARVHGAVDEEDARLVGNPTIRSNVTFIKQQSSETMPHVYANADIFVYPCTIESFGHPLIEAMASGLPVIAADSTVNRELCGSAALYFSPLDAWACADQIATVVHSPEIQRKMSAASRDRSTHFTWARHVNQLLNHMESVAGFRSDADATIANLLETQ
jgi:glycosyltransferase involved in cell wall biosynthesis